MSILQKFLASFPVPHHIAMPAVGLDISDQSVKFIELTHGHDGVRVGRFATKEFPKGIIVGGTIARRDALVEHLSAFREEHGLTFVRASLPEEPGYIFTTQVPDVTPDEVRSLLRFKLEENVPIAPTEAVVDYDPMTQDPSLGPASGNQRIVAVSVFPEKLAQDYADLLHTSGLVPVSLEIEAQALARAVVPRGASGTYMIVDIGRMRSGLAVAQGGAVRFTTTLEIGGEDLTALIKRSFPQADEAEILRIKNEEGLGHTKAPEVKEAMERFAETLRSNVERYYLYWQTHKDAKDAQTLPMSNPPITNIILSGGYANIAGLPEYLSRELRVKTGRANVWTNAFSLDTYIPPIPYRESLGYASAIGLALHGDDAY
jgi:type IV pilus assembly protein PilM